MIESFAKNEKQIDYSIIPRLKGWNEITLSQGDTLVIYWDFEKYNMDVAQDFYKMVEKVFPNNQILFMPKESKMGVVKNE